MARIVIMEDVESLLRANLTEKEYQRILDILNPVRTVDLHMTGLEMMRRCRGLSREKLAQKAGLSITTIWQIENKYRCNPREETLHKLANVLDCNVGVIM